jgi:hypothetical protein
VQQDVLDKAVENEEYAEETDDDELIAVITAAITCMMEGDSNFVVRHVRRISRAPRFALEGREDQMYSHY